MSDTPTSASLAKLDALELRPQSSVVTDEAEYGLVQGEHGQRLAVLVADPLLLERFEGSTSMHGERTLLLGPLSAQNIAALRERFDWLRPRTLGLRTSAGLGDRLGLATPGHVRAVRAVGGDIAPIFAQQSIREMTRTGRTPQQVMDDATWGVFAEGWRDGFGADADHLKTPADIDACVAAGYTFYTIDPGEYVNNAAEAADVPELRSMAAELPWSDLEDDLDTLVTRYRDRVYEVEDQTISFDEQAALRAAVKYGGAIAHVARMYRHLQQAIDRPFELEVSVDETEMPTSHAEHIFIAGELRRLGVEWVSLAPRYIGQFEKGVDYIGDLQAFEADFAVHASIARQFGPYKLSLHSGSDKFSVYPVAMRRTQGRVHLKTAGTSYLEALHTIAELDPAFFRAIYAFARERYETDRASYHVSASLVRAPQPEDVGDDELPQLLDQFDAREILHVTFGSVLKERKADGSPRFYDYFMDLLRRNPEAYAANLETHFRRHLLPFAAKAEA